MKKSQEKIAKRTISPVKVNIKKEGGNPKREKRQVKVN